MENRERWRQFDSKIINLNDINRIAGWIDYRQIPYSYQENPFEFKLLLRGSRDGFGIDTFHDLCDNNGATIVVVKVENSGKVIGGYNPINWSKGKIIGNDYYGRIIFRDYRCYTCNSFIFSLTNRNDSILSRVNSPIESIYWSSRKGPYFGDDLCMSSSSTWNSITRFYEHKIISEETFFAEDYEVFQVSIKNHQIRRKQMFENVDYTGILCVLPYDFWPTNCKLGNILLSMLLPRTFIG
ncbi:4701_t:CDS:2 [Dentiscutata erythropus]|uniref:4701_t:CDS:1 n=1 Tax=Dentiscutata erythropus TaxID=1348616 RepID=A0A9N9J4G3_9GLOM|nr:4701_t:CDS:2 [Dentiscutata erythropus]